MSSQCANVCYRLASRSYSSLHFCSQSLKANPISKSVSKSNLAGIFAGGIGGLLLQSAAVTAIVGAPYMVLITTWVRYVVAIALVALFCAFYKTLTQGQALVASLVAGSIIPAMPASFAFGSGAPWLTLLGFNLLFSVIALVIFRMISRNATT